MQSVKERASVSDIRQVYRQPDVCVASVDSSTAACLTLSASMLLSFERQTHMSSG